MGAALNEKENDIIENIHMSTVICISEYQERTMTISESLVSGKISFAEAVYLGNDSSFMRINEEGKITRLYYRLMSMYEGRTGSILAPLDKI